MAGGGSGGGGSNVGGRHKELNRLCKRLDSCFFDFGFLLLFLASVTKDASECLPCSQNRVEWWYSVFTQSPQGGEVGPPKSTMESEGPRQARPPNVIQK